MMSTDCKLFLQHSHCHRDLEPSHNICLLGHAGEHYWLFCQAFEVKILFSDAEILSCLLSRENPTDRPRLERALLRDGEALQWNCQCRQTWCWYWESTLILRSLNLTIATFWNSSLPQSLVHLNNRCLPDVLNDIVRASITNHHHQCATSTSQPPSQSPRWVTECTIQKNFRSLKKFTFSVDFRF